MDAFRSINPELMMQNTEPRQTTSNEGKMRKAEMMQRLRGLNKMFYSVNTSSRSTDKLEV